MSPGNDGRNSEISKPFQDDVLEFISKVSEEALATEKRPLTLSQGLISLIPKPDKDPSLIENLEKRVF